MNRIAQFEALVERLVEGTFTRLFAGQLSPRKVATHLIRAMEDHQVCFSGIAPQSPTHYWVYLNPNDYEAMVPESEGSDKAEPSFLEDELAHHVADLASEAGLALEVSPIVRILCDEDVPPRDVRIDARWMPDEADEMERTREMEASDKPASDQMAATAPRGRPFLVLEGRRHVNLTQPVVSIGRALDNDVIIEDPRVSRHHTQLRQRYGHYVLYDLGSSGGTKINGYPIEECVLHSGDVISLAGIQIIYGVDPPTPIPLPESEDTPPFPIPKTESRD